MTLLSNKLLLHLSSVGLQTALRSAVHGSASVAAPPLASQKRPQTGMMEMVVKKPECLSRPANIPQKLLLGPGPSNSTPDILNSMTAPLLGHLHSEFTKIMDEVKEGIQYVFQTKNRLTFAVSGTGHAGMECALVNLLEPGDRVLVAHIGIWGERAAEIAARAGANVQLLSENPGTVIDFPSLQNAIESFRPHVVFVCHGESSTGVCQPLENFGQLCRDHDALLLVDTVASLGGASFHADRLLVDCVYTSPQKVLNAPPGVAPISFNERAYEKIKNRQTKIQSFYFDANLLGNYWGCFDEPRKYHHTAPISTVYALRAALARLTQIGLEDSVETHKRNAQLLYTRLEEAGLHPFVTDPNIRLPCLTTVAVPDGVDWKGVMDKLMSQKIEIAGGLGVTVGKLWRIGTFGVNSSPENIDRVVGALKDAIDSQSKLN